MARPGCPIHRALVHAEIASGLPAKRRHPQTTRSDGKHVGRLKPFQQPQKPRGARRRHDVRAIAARDRRLRRSAPESPEKCRAGEMPADCLRSASEISVPSEESKNSISAARTALSMQPEANGQSGVLRRPHPRSRSSRRADPLRFDCGRQTRREPNRELDIAAGMAIAGRPPRGPGFREESFQPGA